MDPDTTETSLRLRFDGTVVVPGGLPKQNLVEEELTPAAPGHASDAFLRQLMRVRPDLRDALEARGIRAPAAQGPGWEALLVHGGAFEKTADEIEIWRDNLALVRAWLFLVYDTSPGHTFSLQLIPDLADDVFLHGTMRPVEAANVPAGTYPECLRVDYRIDYGTAECTDPDSSDPLGTFRPETTGYVLYAPEVGPVKSFEELVYHDATGDCGVPVDVVVQRVILELTAAHVAVEPVTWGALKTRY